MSPPGLIASRLGLRTLTARSVLLSVLLGAHPPELPVRALVRAGALFGIPDGTTRVALSRLVSEGDLEADAGRYRLTAPQLARQRRQDEGRAAATLRWDGSWELVVAAPDVRAADARAEMAAALSPLRLAEWRDGTWTRPANLARALPSVLPAGGRATRIGALPDPSLLASQLWALDAWAVRAHDLLGAMDSRPDPALLFAVCAATVAHLRDDPLLPAPLLPDGWPGDVLRRRYDACEADLTAVLRQVDER